MFPKDELNYKISQVVHSVHHSVSNITNKEISEYSTLFREVGFIQIPSMINSEALEGLFIFIIENAKKYFVSYQGKEREYFDRTISGHKFKRLFFEPQTEYDIATLEHDENWKILSTEMQMASSKLSEIIKPIMEDLAVNFKYNFGSIFYYGNEDFIGLHHDAHYCEMINAQFPLSINTKGCIRIKYKDQLRPYYDFPGCLNILDSKTWHDVPIILKMSNENNATRMNLSLRYMTE